jgi:hypothetical protein
MNTLPSVNLISTYEGMQNHFGDSATCPVNPVDRIAVPRDHDARGANINT